MNEGEKYKQLATRLSKLKKISSLDSATERECDTLAHSFLDLKDSFKKFNDVFLPIMFDINTTDEELEDVLTDIGDEFRHILYHIKDSKYYQYLNR